MNFEGNYELEATPAEVWSALNSEDILGRCIPGCETVEKQEDGTFAATVALRIGPIKARFRGSVEIEEIKPLTEYVIRGEGKGGVAGFAKGYANVFLIAQPEHNLTQLNYQIDAQMGGKIAQLGGRLIESTVRKLSQSFFQELAQELSASNAREDGVVSS